MYDNNSEVSHLQPILFKKKNDRNIIISHCYPVMYMQVNSQQILFHPKIDLQILFVILLLISIVEVIQYTVKAFLLENVFFFCASIRRLTCIYTFGLGKKKENILGCYIKFYRWNNDVYFDSY